MGLPALFLILKTHTPSSSPRGDPFSYTRNPLGYEYSKIRRFCYLFPS